MVKIIYCILLTKMGTTSSKVEDESNTFTPTSTSTSTSYPEPLPSLLSTFSTMAQTNVASEDAPLDMSVYMQNIESLKNTAIPYVPVKTLAEDANIKFHPVIEEGPPLDVETNLMLWLTIGLIGLIIILIIALIIYFAARSAKYPYGKYKY